MNLVFPAHCVPFRQFGLFYYLSAYLWILFDVIMQKTEYYSDFYFFTIYASKKKH